MNLLVSIGIEKNIKACGRQALIIVKNSDDAHFGSESVPCILIVGFDD